MTETLAQGVPLDVEPDPDVRITSTGGGMPGVRLYWLAVLGLIPVAYALIAWENSSSSGWGRLAPEGILLFVLLFFPVVQLVASLIGFILVEFLPAEQRQESRLAVGKITGFALLGTAVGILGCCLLAR